MSAFVSAASQGRNSMDPAWIRSPISPIGTKEEANSQRNSFATHSYLNTKQVTWLSPTPVAAQQSLGRLFEESPQQHPVDCTDLLSTSGCCSIATRLFGFLRSSRLVLKRVWRSLKSGRCKADIGGTSQIGIEQGSLHYTPEHCPVNGGVPLCWWKKPCFKWARCIS